MDILANGTVVLSQTPCDECGLMKDSCRDTWGNDDTSTNTCADCEPWGKGSNDDFYSRYYNPTEDIKLHGKDSEVAQIFHEQSPIAEIVETDE